MIKFLSTGGGNITSGVYPFQQLLGSTKITITSTYGWRNWGKEPWPNFHYGVDIRASIGTPIYCPMPMNATKEYRNMAIEMMQNATYFSVSNNKASDIKENKDRIYIIRMPFYSYNRGWTFSIFFMHVQKINSSIGGGRYREDGIIGYTGESGSPGQPHLHLEIWASNRGFAHVSGLNGQNSKIYSVSPKEFLIPQFNLNYVQGAVLGEKKEINYSRTGEPWVNQVNQAGDFKKPQAQTPKPKETEAAPEPKKEKKIQLKSILTKRYALGIWQIIKMVMDSSVENKQVYDASIGTQQGSILNFFNKVCQRPLVEFSGDTFGNQYYFLIRRPPFDSDGYNRTRELITTDIEDNQIISLSLSYSTESIYSWYQFIPSAELIDIPEQMLFMPAVFFPEYAAIYGSKPLSVQSQYYTWCASGVYNQKSPYWQSGDNIIRNAVKDFKYLIESNAYNPFVRSGTVTIIGDRRIKRGTFVRIGPEVYYVDNVINNYSIQMNGVIRQTTLSLSHGMMEDYIDRYFNLIDFGDWNIDKIDSKNWQQKLSKFKVNIENFSFFLNKQYNN